jgi:hypothetical protein
MGMEMLSFKTSIIRYIGFREEVVDNLRRRGQLLSILYSFLSERDLLVHRLHLLALVTLLGYIRIEDC